MSGETCESLRQEGNDQYRAGKFDAAVRLYKKAIELGPSEIAPRSNLSIALFEAANYEACDEACNSALALLAGEAQDAVAKQKIYARQARARLASNEIKEAGKAVNLLVEGPEKAQLTRLLATLSGNAKAVADSKALHTRLILELPRYKPHVRTIPEYYCYGHDTPEPLYTSDLLKTGRKKVSLMFGGIGDARNLHCSLLNIMGDEVDKGKKTKLFTKGAGSGKVFHFTLVDIKPAAIARDLIVFLLLNEVADYEGDVESVKKHKLFPCLYYTYLAPTMPRGVYDVLQKRIKTLIEMLEGHQELPDFLDVPQLYRPDIIRVLHQWQSEAAEEYPPARMRKSAVAGMTESEMMQQYQLMQYAGLMAPPDRAPRGCAKEKKFYTATGILPITSPDYKLYRPEFRACIDAYDTASSAKAKADVLSKAYKIADETWACNVTFVDLDWQRTKPLTHSSYEIDVGHNVFDFADKLGELGLNPPRAQGLYDYVLMWFMMVASAVGELKHRMKIEACVGDVTAVLEQIRYGVVGHREESNSQSAASTTAPSVGDVKTNPSTQEELNEYPQVYDRIHLSNIPDYIGGTLSSFIYASPLTHEGKSSYITSTNLRNPPRFPSIASFDNEYIALSAPSDLMKVFQVSMEPLEDPGEEMPTCRYNVWHRHCVSKDLQNLMSRERLETWLRRLFLKIAIPKDKSQIQSNELIYSPLNFTFFFRLLVHLHGAGYPAHWLSSVWAEILSGTIKTTARPPRSEPLSLKEVTARMPAIEQSTTPFMAELTTLTALWQPTLPFIVPAPNIAKLEDVHQYSVRFSDVSDSAENIPTFILAFYDRRLPNVKQSMFSTLRKHLLDDEQSLPKNTDQARKINREGLHIITTWKYDQPSKTATFWFRSDTLEKMRAAPAAKQLHLAIWRTDNWTRQSSAQTLNRIHDHGVWIHGENVPMPKADSSDDEDDEEAWEDEDDSGTDDEGVFHGRYAPSDNPHVNMLQQYMEMSMRAMPGDSREQRLSLAEQLIQQGMSEMRREGSG